MSADAALDGIDDRDIPKMELLTAAFNNDVEKIECLMQNGQVHIDSTDDDDVTALHIAASMGNNHLVKRLLDYGANIEACNQLGMTAFHHASREGKLSVIDTLLQRGADYRKLTSMGVNALTLASAGGHADVVKKLLSLRDESWRCGPRNRSLAPTPLIVATFFKSSQICNYLIRAGAQIDETVDTLKGLSALSTAIICTPGVYMVTSLLDLGANQAKKSLHRLNALELAKAFKRKDIANILYEKRAPRNKFDAYYDIRKLIAEDSITDRIIDQPTQDGCTLLMFATIMRSINSAKSLVQRDVDINARDNLNINALQIACLLRVDELAQIYLAKQSSTYGTNKFGLTAYDLYVQSTDVIESNSLRSQLHPHRSIQIDVKLNLSSSSASLYKTLQPKGWLNKVSSQIFMSPIERQTESIEPKHWLDVFVQYQPVKERNPCKFANVDEILRCTKAARAPDVNPYDAATDAMRAYMEDCQSFLATCFVDIYGDRVEESQSQRSSTQLFSGHYDIAQFNARCSGYPPSRKFHRNSLSLHRRDSIDSTGSERRKVRSFVSMFESPSQNQMRTTPRMLKKSRDSMAEAAESGTRYYSAQHSRSNRIGSAMVPKVVVGAHRTPSYVITDEMIWAQFVKRNQVSLMQTLKDEEIDRYSFLSLTESNLHEMNIRSKADISTIKEIQKFFLTGSM